MPVESWVPAPALRVLSMKSQGAFLFSFALCFRGGGAGGGQHRCWLFAVLNLWDTVVSCAPDVVTSLGWFVYSLAVVRVAESIGARFVC